MFSVLRQVIGIEIQRKQLLSLLLRCFPPANSQGRHRSIKVEKFHPTRTTAFYWYAPDPGSNVTKQLHITVLWYMKPFFPRTLKFGHQYLNSYHYINYKFALGIVLLWFCVEAGTTCLYLAVSLMAFKKWHLFLKNWPSVGGNKMKNQLRCHC